MQTVHPFKRCTAAMAAVAAATALATGTAPALAATVLDTGTPNGSAVGAYALDGTDFLAGQVSFAQAMTLQAIATHLLGVSAGDTFTLALYRDNAAHLPGTLLYAAQATVSAPGWNGITGLSGWAVAAGLYWVGIEVNAADNAGGSTATGALLDAGAPLPLARTAFNAGGGYQLASPAETFGMRIDAVAVAVPEPGSMALLLLGLPVLLGLAARRRT